MTHDEMIAVIAADRDGRIIQAVRRYEPFQLWKDCITGDPTMIRLNFQNWNYRIKPEPPKPREWLMHEVGKEECMRVREVI